MKSHRWTVGDRMLLTAALALWVSSARADFFVGRNPGSNFSTPGPQVLHYDNSGNFLGIFVTPSNGLGAPRGLAFGPDGNLYVSNNPNPSNPLSSTVLRYDGTTGAVIDAFVSAGSGGLKSPEALVFRNDGFLYVSNFGTNPTNGNVLDGQVTRYDAATGAFDSVFATSADIRGNADGMAFAPNGDLFVSVLNRNSPDVPGVLTFDGTTGAFKGQFTQGGSLVVPRTITFGPDGNLYVIDITESNGVSRIARFDGTTGQYIDDYISLDSNLHAARGLGFGPDGRLYISTTGNPNQPYDLIWTFDGTTLSVFIDGNADGSGLTFPTYFVFQ